VATRLRPVLIAGLCALAAGTLTVAVMLSQHSTDGESNSGSGGEVLTLDDPSVVQEPTIATNSDVSGKALPLVDLLRLDDSTIGIGDLLDGRPLVVNLWFSTCQPCKREMPAIEAAHEEYGDRVRFIGVNVQDSPETASSFARDLDIGYEILRDPDGNLTAAAGVATFPMTFFVSANGVIISQIAGEMSTDEIEAGVAGVLAT